MITAKDIMKTPITVGKGVPVSVALRMMLDKDISRLLVSDNDKLVGIVTERDIGFFLMAEQTKRKIDEIPISEIVNPLITVNQVASVTDCAQTMISKKIGSVGVNLNNKTQGIITKTDLTRYYVQNFVGQKRAGDVMTITCMSAYENDPIYEVLPRMIVEKISRVIIKNNDEQPVGVLSFRDLFRASLTLGKEDVIADEISGISVLFTRKGFLSKAGFGATILVKQLMTPNIITVEHDDDLVIVATALLENNVNGVGVVVNNKLTGIVSKTDITRAITAIVKQSKDTV
jgi:CBS domain-containing protein